MSRVGPDAQFSDQFSALRQHSHIFSLGDYRAGFLVKPRENVSSTWNGMCAEGDTLPTYSELRMHEGYFGYSHVAATPCASATTVTFDQVNTASYLSFVLKSV